MRATTLLSLILPFLAARSSAGCTPNTTDTSTLQSLLRSGGAGYTLQLCQGQVYNTTDILNYTASDQEISTENYPTDLTRATILVGGFNVTTAVSATDPGLDGCKLRNVQINGNRGDAAIYQGSNANIEMGGANANQLIEYVRSYDPRGWSCMHIAEGPYQCINTTIQNNDIGPCGSPVFQNWADGISLSCQSSLVQNNVITDATDGGIVVFGAPFSTIRNNTIQVKTRTMLGGINLVDVLPWQPEGNYSHTLIEGNFINGGFATDYGNETLGKNNASAIIKIGIAIGPQVWFDNQYGNNQSMGGTVQNNVLSGAFAFGMGVSSAKNFVIQNNAFNGNVSFTGSYGPNCSQAEMTPNPPVPLLVDSSSTSNMTMSVPQSSAAGQGAFAEGTAYGLTCFLPLGTDQIAWPYGGGQVDSVSPTTTGSASASSTSAASATSSGKKHGAAGRRICPPELVAGGVLGILGLLWGETIVL